jgi:hypothetical protein
MLLTFVMSLVHVSLMAEKETFLALSSQLSEVSHRTYHYEK